MEEANYLALRVTANDRSMSRKQTTFVESLSNRKTVPITVNCNSELSSRKIFQMAFTWLTNVTGCRLRSFLPGNGRFFDRNLDRDHVRSDVRRLKSEIEKKERMYATYAFYQSDRYRWKVSG